MTIPSSSAKKVENFEKVYEGGKNLKLVADNKKPAQLLASREVSSIQDPVELSDTAKLEQVWAGLDPEGKIQGKFKKFEITNDGYEIVTKRGGKAVVDISNKTSVNTFKRGANEYKVYTEWREGAENLNITKVIKDGKVIRGGDFSYIDGDVGYIYEGIRSNDKKDYFKTKLHRFDTDYFKAVDGNIVSDREWYNELYNRSKELDSLMKTVPVDDGERSKVKSELIKTINYCGDRDYSSACYRLACKGYETLFPYSRRDGRSFISTSALKSCDDMKFGELINEVYGSGIYEENDFADDLIKLRTLLQYDGRDEMEAVKHEYDTMLEKMENMRNDVDYQARVKSAVEENILPGVVVE